MLTLFTVKSGTNTLAENNVFFNTLRWIQLG